MSIIEPTWEEVQKEILKIRCLDLKIWKDIEDRPLNCESIYELIGSGWKIRHANYIINGSYCYSHDKEIVLEKDIKYFERDINLFHEIAHAWYGEPLNDGFAIINYRRSKFIIAEYLARQSRVNKYLLRSAVLAFNLKPYVYDLVSYLAFPNKSYNAEVKPDFSAKELTKILM